MTQVRSRLRLGLLVASALGAVALTALVPAASGHPFHPAADTPDTTAPGLVLRRVGSFNFPVYVAAPPGDTSRQFVVQQDGRIKLIKDGRIVARPFLDVSSLIDFNQSERGLLSMAFPPDYAQTRRFYIFYTARDGDLTIDELKHGARTPTSPTRTPAAGRSRSSTRSLGTTTAASSRLGRAGDSTSRPATVAAAAIPWATARTGTACSARSSASTRRPSGSRPYTIPAGNPFVGRSGRDEIWAYGLRNPWRFSFDRANGNMAIGDVGQGAIEEVDFTVAGRSGMNFGWNCFEGTASYDGCSVRGHVRPVLQYTHEGGGSCAVTGGYVVRDPGVARLRGKYLYGDYCTGALHAANLREGGATANESLSLVVPWLTGFGEDARGRVYATSRGMGSTSGAVYRLEAAP